MNLRLSAFLKLLPLVSLAALTGCGRHSDSQSRLASQLPMRGGQVAVEATVDGPASITSMIENNVPNVIVHFGGNRQIVIEETSIRVDNEVYPPAPAGTKKITIQVTDGKVTLAADGKPLTK